MEYPKASFYVKNIPKYLDETEAKSEVKKAILAVIVRNFVEMEARLVSSMNNIYGIIWVYCTPGIHSLLKVNKESPSK